MHWHARASPVNSEIQTMINPLHKDTKTLPIHHHDDDCIMCCHCKNTSKWLPSWSLFSPIIIQNTDRSCCHILPEPMLPEDRAFLTLWTQFITFFCCGLKRHIHLHHHHSSLDESKVREWFCWRSAGYLQLHWGARQVWHSCQAPVLAAVRWEGGTRPERTTALTISLIHKHLITQLRLKDPSCTAYQHHTCRQYCVLSCGATVCTKQGLWVRLIQKSSSCREKVGIHYTTF